MGDAVLFRYNTSNQTRHVYPLEKPLNCLVGCGVGQSGDHSSKLWNDDHHEDCWDGMTLCSFLPDVVILRKQLCKSVRTNVCWCRSSWVAQILGCFSWSIRHFTIFVGQSP